MHSIKQIAQKLSATIVGDENRSFKNIKPLEQAGPEDLSFFAPTGNKKIAELMEMAKNSTAAALLVTQAYDEIKTTQIITPNPLGAIVMIATMFFSAKRPPAVVDKNAAVSPTAKIGENVSVGAFAVIGDEVEIGDNSIIHPHAVIYYGSKIGKNCQIHAGAIIRENVILGDHCVIQNGVVVGGDGFGYFPDKDIGHRHIPHIGNVVLESYVDMGANATIDRAMLGEARVGRATKIDNLVMIGHNAQIGERTLICGSSGIAGSCKIGNDVIIGGGVGVADHLTIGDKVRAIARSGITTDVPANTDVGGYPQTTAHNWRREVALIRKLPDLFKDLREIKRKLSSL
ncbi:MAG: UDP-3-O-(3-hydroxymyristoyl)glucosamine N-acyltransferase [Proteobacteria bacterium]|nr:UDP-3-O-(3-hydroxymyristoyl)glucosamine N-acyltransferase [Pseudomonadota bacterium]